MGFQGSASRRICVVSDSEEIRRLLAALLEADGYLVSNEATLDAGLDRAARFQPDAVVVEATGEAAKSLVSRLRQRPALASCGLLVLSARVETPAHSQGAWATFSKPFDLLKLQSAVATCSTRPLRNF